MGGLWDEMWGSRPCNLVAIWRKAIWSLRLRQRSGLRQRGSALGAGFVGTAEAVPVRVVMGLGIVGGLALRELTC